jgi:hypothetical protein
MNPRLVGRVFRTLIFSLLLSPLPFFHAPIMARATSTPMIGEVMWAGSSLSSADEWLELWNNSDEPLALAGYVLRGASQTDIVFNETDTVPARGTFLVSNYIDTDPKTMLATSTQLVTTAISLSNSSLKIDLIAPNGTVIDSAGDGGTPPAGSSLPIKASMIRQIDGMWTSTTSSINVKAMTDFATPGICDGCTHVIPSEAEESLDPIIEPIIEPDPELPIIEIPTSTDPVIPSEIEESPQTTSIEPVIESTTSTEPVLEPLVGTSSTTQANSTSTIELPVIPSVPVVITTILTPTSTTTVTPILDLRLNAVFPAPESGEEWIEIFAPTNTTVAQAANWSLHDASGSIFRFTSNDSRIVVSGNIWHVTLASARLNNGGDTVELVRPDGSVAERMIYPETPKGTTWRKNTDAWTQDPLPTPIEETITIKTISTASQTPPSPTIELPVIPITEPEEPSSKTTGSSKSTSIKTTATKTTATKTTKPKTTTVKSEIPPPLVTLDMLTKLEPEIRVALEGTVGTVPGILGKNQFTIHTPDGRGLFVRGTSKQVSPAFGDTIRLTGTLSLNDDGLSLKMLSKDSWSRLENTETVESRVVDLLAPSQEDAWSLIQVTGTVLEVGSGKAEIELGGFPITVKIRPASGYRSQRLSKGDEIRVLGIIDTRGEEPILYPRMDSDIQIIDHAKLMPAGKPQTTLPAWTPFGAAGITVAVTEGYKRLRKLAKERKLKKLAALAQ